MPIWEAVKLDKEIIHVDYDTDEYESLLIELHLHSRSTSKFQSDGVVTANGDGDANKRKRDGEPKKRKLFLCKYCERGFTNKMRINAHRHRGCDGLLDDRGKPSRLKLFPPLPSGGARVVAEMAAKLRKKEVAAQKRCAPRRGREKEKAGGSRSQASGMDTTASVEQTVEAEELHLAKSALEELQSAGAKQPEEDGSEAANKVTERETREQTKIDAEAKAATFKLDWTPQLAMPVDIKKRPGFHYLMSFGLLNWQWEEQTLDSFYAQVRNLVDTRGIDDRVAGAYGQWAWDRQASAPDDEKKAVEKFMSRFRRENPTLLKDRYTELFELRAWIEQRDAIASYNAEQMRYKGELEDLRHSYILGKLLEFDIAVVRRRQGIKWGWNPLHKILCGVSIQDVPAEPWSHTVDEANKLCAALSSRRTEWTPPCVFFMLLKWFSILQGSREQSITCPSAWFSALEVVGPRRTDMMVAAVDALLEEGMFLFHGLDETADVAAATIAKSLKDVRAGNEQGQSILRAFEDWSVKVRQRAVEDMALKHPEDFVALWTRCEEEKAEKFLKQFKSLLLHRELMDFGWTPLHRDHSDRQSDAVLLRMNAAKHAMTALFCTRSSLDEERLGWADRPMRTLNVQSIKGPDEFHVRANTDQCAVDPDCGHVMSEWPLGAKLEHGREGMEIKEPMVVKSE